MMQVQLACLYDEADNLRNEICWEFSGSLLFFCAVTGDITYKNFPTNLC